MDIGSAQQIPEGAVIAKTYWSAPRGYVNPGPEFSTDVEAIEYAVAELRKLIKQHEEFYAGQKILPLPESITLDLRWTIQLPQGGSYDTVAARQSFKDIAAAEHRLALIEKYRK